ncbi:MAG TPA: glycine--tRNA ligase subunit beta, partial [Arenimonas sp.]|nr:glycine--tRNA ligase subunit beta [Arenimonas sp.]
MSQTLPLLIELGTEELPPKALPELAQAFFDGVMKGLDERRLLPVDKDHTAGHALGEASIGSIGLGAAVLPSKPKPLYSPRRLAVLLPAVLPRQPSQNVEVLGPYVNIGLDESGQPTPALLGFAQKQGVDVSQLERISDAKGMRYAYRAVKPGATTAELLPSIVQEAIRAMPVPKPMRWGDHDFAFVRPAHWLVMLLGKEIVPGEVLGLTSSRNSRGHRFHHDKQVWLNHAEEYIGALREAHVLVDADERRRRVREEIEAAARQGQGTPRITEALLEEVNCLVEWPKGVLCSFDKDFLAVPQEALISTMEQNQKFFPVLDHNGRLTERFVGVANIESNDVEEVRKGYERVIRPRFADAKFFFDEDLKQGIVAMASGLGDVTYQQKLGSYADKSLRVANLAQSIAEQLGSDAEQARSAAKLAKADLQSRMVGEFPELQGIAGRYYASAAG